MTLPKRSPAELAADLRERAGWLTGQPFEVPATKAMMCEAADLLEKLDPPPQPPDRLARLVGYLRNSARRLAGRREVGE